MSYIRKIFVIVLCVQIVCTVFAADYAPQDDSRYIDYNGVMHMVGNPKFERLGTLDRIKSVSYMLQTNNTNCGILFERLTFFSATIPRKIRYEMSDEPMFWAGLRLLGEFKVLAKKANEAGANGARSFEEEVDGFYCLFSSMAELFSKNLDDDAMIDFTNQCATLSHASPQNQSLLFYSALQETKRIEDMNRSELQFGRELSACLGIPASSESISSTNSLRRTHKWPSEIKVNGRTLRLKVNNESWFQLYSLENKLIANGRCGVEKDAETARLRGLASWAPPNNAKAVAPNLQYDYIGENELILRVRFVLQGKATKDRISISSGNRWGYCSCQLKDDAVQYLLAILEM